MSLLHLDPVGQSRSTDYETGKDLHSFITTDKEGNEIYASIKYDWRKHKDGGDIEYSFDIIAYPDNTDKAKVDEDAKEALVDELRNIFGHQKAFEQI